MPMAFNWEPGKKAKYYIKASGGKKKGGIEQMYVEHASGKTENISFFKNPQIYPGSNIILIQKDKTQRSEKFRESIDKFTNVFSILTGALTSVLLITRL